MTAIDSIVEDLKLLPEKKVEDAAWFVHVLVRNSANSRHEILRRTATALSAADVEEMERAINSACEDTDEHTW